MYVPTSPGLGTADCSGWEQDPQSFSKVLAEHHLRTELGLPLSATGGPYKVTATVWRVNFPNKIAVYVTLAKAPDFVVAARWYPKPAGRSRFYAYSCAPGAKPVFKELKKP